MRRVLLLEVPTSRDEARVTAVMEAIPIQIGLLPGEPSLAPFSADRGEAGAFADVLLGFMSERGEEQPHQANVASAEAVIQALLGQGLAQRLTLESRSWAEHGQMLDASAEHGLPTAPQGEMPGSTADSRRLWSLLELVREPAARIRGAMPGHPSSRSPEAVVAAMSEMGEDTESARIAALLGLFRQSEGAGAGLMLPGTSSAEPDGPGPAPATTTFQRPDQLDSPSVQAWLNEALQAAVPLNAGSSLVSPTPGVSPDASAPVTLRSPRIPPGWFSSATARAGQATSQSLRAALQAVALPHQDDAQVGPAWSMMQGPATGEAFQPTIPAPALTADRSGLSNPIADLPAAPTADATPAPAAQAESAQRQATHAAASPTGTAVNRAQQPSVAPSGDQSPATADAVQQVREPKSAAVTNGSRVETAPATEPSPAQRPAGRIAASPSDSTEPDLPGGTARAASEGQPANSARLSSRAPNATTDVPKDVSVQGRPLPQGAWRTAPASAPARPVASTGAEGPVSRPSVVTNSSTSAVDREALAAGDRIRVASPPPADVRLSNGTGVASGSNNVESQPVPAPQSVANATAGSPSNLSAPSRSTQGAMAQVPEPAMPAHTADADVGAPKRPTIAANEARSATVISAPQTTAGGRTSGMPISTAISPDSVVSGLPREAVESPPTVSFATPEYGVPNATDVTARADVAPGSGGIAPSASQAGSGTSPAGPVDGGKAGLAAASPAADLPTGAVPPASPAPPSTDPTESEPVRFYTYTVAPVAVRRFAPLREGGPEISLGVTRGAHRSGQQPSDATAGEQPAARLPIAAGQSLTSAATDSGLTAPQQPVTPAATQQGAADARIEGTPAPTAETPSRPLSNAPSQQVSPAAPSGDADGASAAQLQTAPDGRAPEREHVPPDARGGSTNNGSEAQTRTPSAPGPGREQPYDPVAVQAGDTQATRREIPPRSESAPQQQSSSGPLPTGTRDELSATQTPDASAGATNQPQDRGLPTSDRPHVETPASQPEPKLKFKPEPQSQPQPQPQLEPKQLIQDAHFAREIARPDLGPIAYNMVEGHAPREAAHLSSPDAAPMEIIEQIARGARTLLRPGYSELTVRLDPPSLGTVHMRVVSQAATMTAHLEVSVEASRDLINAHLPALKQALADVGVAVSQFSVTVGGGQRQDVPQGQVLQPNWHPVAPAAESGSDEMNAAALAALRVWADGGGQHFDAFA